MTRPVHRHSGWVLGGGAVLLGWSAVTLLLSPQGLPPRWLAPWVLPDAWPGWLRAWAALEAALAVALLVPRARRAAALTGALALLAASAVAALGAGDTAFRAQCSALGALHPLLLGAADPLPGVLVGNAALCGLFALGRSREPAPTNGRVRALEQPVVTAVLLGLASLLGAERVRAALLDELAQAREEAGWRRLTSGWPLPPARVRAPGGGLQRLADALQPNDVLIVVGTDCGTCRRLAPSWAAWSQRLSAEDRRLVLLFVDERAPVDAFRREHGVEGLPHLALLGEADTAWLGVPGVPYVLALDAERHVTLEETAGPPLRLGRALALLEARRAGVLEGVERALLAATFGDGCELGAPTADVWTERGQSVAREGQPLGRLHVIGTPVRDARQLEAAIALDPAGRVLALVPLVSGGLLPLADPAWSAPESLKGLALVDALAQAEARAQERSPERPAWLAWARVLRRLSRVR